MNRRSFLGLVAAAVVGPRILAEPENSTEERFREILYSQKPEGGEWWEPYTVCDYATIKPGCMIDELMFPGPQPDEFIVTNLGFYLPASATLDDTKAILDGLFVNVRAGKLEMVQAGLWVLGCFGPFGQRSVPLVPVWGFKSNADMPLNLSIRSNRELDISEPVQIGVALQGNVKLRDA